MVATDREVTAAVEHVAVAAYRIPTDELESDGTLEWDSTTIVVVEVTADATTALGYTYAPAAAAHLIHEKLAPELAGLDAYAVGAAWEKLGARLRNAGRPGIGFSALAAVDVALWDLKARLLGLPLVTVLDGVREDVPVYGSGGFTSYSPERLEEQLAGWVEEGIPRVKIKVARSPEQDPWRLDVARRAVGDEIELYVDASGAFDRKQALSWAERFAAEWAVTWFEEPVSSADFEGLRLLRERAPAGMEIAAGEYGYVLADFRNPSRQARSTSSRRTSPAPASSPASSASPPSPTRRRSRSLAIPHHSSMRTSAVLPRASATSSTSTTTYASRGSSSTASSSRPEAPSAPISRGLATGSSSAVGTPSGFLLYEEER